MIAVFDSRRRSRGKYFGAIWEQYTPQTEAPKAPSDERQRRDNRRQVR